MKRLGMLICLATVLLCACATGSTNSPNGGAATTHTYTPPPSAPTDNQVVSVQADPPVPAFKAGRFALQIDTQPPQSFISSFDLTGGWPDGTLVIYNPLGLQMARLEWTASSAKLIQGNQVGYAANLESLVYKLTGTPLPTLALIDWLGGKPTPAEGWNVDVSEWHLRRLVLERVQPAPRTVLRIAFES
ncbi:MAG: Outer-rane lipoprotein LolB [Pseudomonadota bacterium]|jgi:outer membrane lipoprotein LolB